MVIHHIKAYFENYGVPPIIHVVQGDTLRTFVFDCGEALTEGSETASLFCKRPNESVYSYLGVVDHQTKEVTVVLDDAGGAFTQAGVVAAQLVIQDSGDAVRSFKFDIIVEENFSGTPTPEDVSFLDGLQAQLDEWIEGAQSQLDALDDKIDQEIADRQAAIAAITIPNNLQRVIVPSQVTCGSNSVTIAFTLLPTGAVVDRIDLFLLVSGGTVPQIRTLFRDTRVLGNFVSSDMGGGNGYANWNGQWSTAGLSTYVVASISSGSLWNTTITPSDSARAADCRIYYHIE